MTRLTNTMRDSIISRALAGKFGPQDMALSKQESNLAWQAYEACVKGPHREAIEILFNTEWIEKDDSPAFNVAGASIEFRIPAGMPALPRKGGWREKQVGVVPAGKLADKIMKHFADKEKLGEERTAAYGKLRGLLYATYTLKQLSEVWPEGKEYYQAEIDKGGSIALPVVHVEEINAMLGLPKRK